jgi:hypothetical protein
MILEKSYFTCPVFKKGYNAGVEPKEGLAKR